MRSWYLRGELFLPAVVVGSGLGALGALRLLRRAGIPTFSIPTTRSHESRSRWAQRLPGTQATLASASLADILRGCSLERAALIPCSDAVLSAVAQLPGSLASRFPSSTPSAQAVAQLTRKDQFAMLLAALDVPHPLTLLIDAPQDLERFADMLFTHLFLKPVDSASFMRSYGVKGCRVRDMADAHAASQGACGWPPGRCAGVRSGTGFQSLSYRRLRRYRPVRYARCSHAAACPHVPARLRRQRTWSVCR